MRVIVEITEAMGDPQMRHAALVHAPIVLAPAAAMLALALAASRGKNRTLRWSALVAFAALGVAGLVAASSGGDALAELGAAPLELRRLIARHEAMGEWVWVFGALGVLGAAGTCLPKARLRVASLAVTTVIGGVAAAWVGVVGHFGGTAVYAFGAGTPRPLDQTELLGESNTNGAADLWVDPRVAFFRSEVRPVLAANCMSCHGPGEFASSGLDLTTAGGVLGGGRRGPAVIPGNARASLLYQAASWTHPSLRMPLNRERLSDDAIASLRRWIDEGAVWSAQ